MILESTALLIDNTNRYEADLTRFLSKLHGTIDNFTYDTINEQMAEVRTALWEFKDVLINLKANIQ